MQLLLLAGVSQNGVHDGFSLLIRFHQRILIEIQQHMMQSQFFRDLHLEITPDDYITPNGLKFLNGLTGLLRCPGNDLKNFPVQNRTQIIQMVQEVSISHNAHTGAILPGLKQGRGNVLKHDGNVHHWKIYLLAQFFCSSAPRYQYQIIAPGQLRNRIRRVYQNVCIHLIFCKDLFRSLLEIFPIGYIADIRHRTAHPFLLIDIIIASPSWKDKLFHGQQAACANVHIL